MFADDADALLLLGCSARVHVEHGARTQGQTDAGRAAHHARATHPALRTARQGECPIPVAAVPRRVRLMVASGDDVDRLGGGDRLLPLRRYCPFLSVFVNGRPDVIRHAATVKQH